LGWVVTGKSGKKDKWTLLKFKIHFSLKYVVCSSSNSFHITSVSK
jgi:hypothetical protein